MFKVATRRELAIMQMEEALSQQTPYHGGVELLRTIGTIELTLTNIMQQIKYSTVKQRPPLQSQYAKVEKCRDTLKELYAVSYR